MNFPYKKLAAAMTRFLTALTKPEADFYFSSEFLKLVKLLPKQFLPEVGEALVKVTNCEGYKSMTYRQTIYVIRSLHLTGVDEERVHQLLDAELVGGYDYGRFYTAEFMCEIDYRKEDALALIKELHEKGNSPAAGLVANWLRINDPQFAKRLKEIVSDGSDEILIRFVHTFDDEEFFDLAPDDFIRVWMFLCRQEPERAVDLMEQYPFSTIADKCRAVVILDRYKIEIKRTYDVDAFIGDIDVEETLKIVFGGQSSDGIRQIATAIACDAPAESMHKRCVEFTGHLRDSGNSTELGCSDSAVELLVHCGLAAMDSLCKFLGNLSSRSLCSAKAICQIHEGSVSVE